MHKRVCEDPHLKELHLAPKLERWGTFGRTDNRDSAKLLRPASYGVGATRVMNPMRAPNAFPCARLYFPRPGTVGVVLQAAAPCRPVPEILPLGSDSISQILNYFYSTAKG